jgi:hypothetical protein
MTLAVLAAIGRTRFDITNMVYDRTMFAPSILTSKHRGFQGNGERSLSATRSILLRFPLAPPYFPLHRVANEDRAPVRADKRVYALYNVLGQIDVEVF